MSSCRPRSRSLALCCVCAASQCATRCMFHIPAAVALCGTLQRTHRSTRTVSPKRYGLHSPDLRFALSDFLGFPSASPVSRRILRTQRFQRHICRSADATSLKSVCQTVGSTVARTVRRLIRSIQIDTHRRSALTRKVSSFPCEHAARCWDSLEWDPLHPSLTPPPRFVASVKTQSGAIRRKVQLYAARVRPSRPSHR